MVVAHVPVDGEVGVAVEHAAQTARVGGFLMGEEQVFERASSPGEDVPHLALDDGEILGVSRLHEHGGFRADDEKCRVIGVVNFAL